MFILRQIHKDNIESSVETNTILGVYYSLILKDKSPDTFNDTIKDWSKDVLTELYAVVTFDDGSSIMPLYKDSLYYIMTSDGNTFSNISFK